MLSKVGTRLFYSWDHPEQVLTIFSTISSPYFSMYSIWRLIAFFTSAKVKSLLDWAPNPWVIICYWMKGASRCWYWAKCCSEIPIFAMICCWIPTPIYWIWVMPCATILRYWSRFWFLFCLLYILLSFLKFLEYLKISFFEASREKMRIFLTSSNEGFWRLMEALSFWISRSRLKTSSFYSWCSPVC